MNNHRHKSSQPATTTRALLLSTFSSFSFCCGLDIFCLSRRQSAEKGNGGIVAGPRAGTIIGSADERFSIHSFNGHASELKAAGSIKSGRTGRGRRRRRRSGQESGQTTRLGEQGKQQETPSSASDRSQRNVVKQQRHKRMASLTLDGLAHASQRLCRLRGRAAGETETTFLARSRR